jgi:hypothetical protein
VLVRFGTIRLDSASSNRNSRRLDWPNSWDSNRNSRRLGRPNSWDIASRGAPAIGFPLERFPWAEAMLSFARPLGAAQTGDIPGAQAEIAKLQSLEDKLLEAKDSYWASQVEVQRLGAAGILAHVQGDDKKAIELARAAADLARRWTSILSPLRLTSTPGGMVRPSALAVLRLIGGRLRRRGNENIRRSVD